MDVLTRPELRLLLGTDHAVDVAVRGGAWRRVVRGAYVPGDLPDTLHVRARAAKRLLPAHALLADRCLLWVLGVDVLPPGEPVVECVVPRGVVVPKRKEIRVREALVTPADVGVLDGSGLTALRPARATVDLMRLLPRAEALAVVDAVLRAQLCERTRLEEEMHRHRGLRNVERARWALRVADGRAESPPESRVRAVLLDAGLEPVPQYEVRTSAGLFRLDLAFPWLKVAIEYDGRQVHDRASAFTSDRRRQNALVAEGWTVLRFTAEDLRAENRAELVRVVLAALRSQTRRTA